MVRKEVKKKGLTIANQSEKPWTIMISTLAIKTIKVNLSIQMIKQQEK